MFNKANSSFKKRPELFFKPKVSSENSIKAPDTKSKALDSAKNSNSKSSSASFKSLKALSWSNKGFEDDKQEKPPVKEQESRRQMVIESNDTDSDSDGNGFVTITKTVRLPDENESSSNKENNPPGAPTLKRTKSITSIVDSIHANARKATKYESITDTFAPQHAKVPEWEKKLMEKNKSTRVELSSEQKIVAHAAFRGDSIFFTGAAGTGKSVVLREIIADQRSKYGEQAVAVCATTGLAALNIGGTTIHRWAGIGTGEDKISSLKQKIRKSNEKRRNWKQTRVLIIDEVSMLDAALFDKLEALGQEFGFVENETFGGIQVILTGDFYQLPPVVKNPRNNSSGGNKNDDNSDNTNKSPYCFNADCWDRVIKKHYILKEVFRQKGDNTLISMLNAIRIGNVDSSTQASFQSLCRELEWKNGIEPSRLYPTKAEVSKANEQRLHHLKGFEKEYSSFDEITNGAPYEKENATKILDPLLLAPSKIKLKQNTLVMFVKNDPAANLVNGDKGIVTSFIPEKEWPELLKLESRYSGFKALYEKMFASSVFGGDLKQLSAETHSPRMRMEFAKFRGRIMNNKVDELLPVVRFSNGVETTIGPMQFEVTDGNGKKKGVRQQLPLIHSWAISIHKSQGQTLDGVIVDLGRAFEMGQAYVALSRATSMDSLQVLNFHKSKVMVSNEVIGFYNRLQNKKQ